MYQKAAVGVLGAVGTSYAAYKLFFPWIGKDYHDYTVLIKARDKFLADAAKGNRIIDILEDTVRRNADKYFFIFENKIFTYGEILADVYRVAQIAKTWNLKRGEVVALFMENEPAYVSIVFGLQVLGIPVALINHNLRNEALEHSLKCVDSKVIITGGGDELVTAISNIHPNLPGVKLLVHGRPDSQLPLYLESLTDLMSETPPTPMGREARSHTTIDDVSVFIYTSGTTGLPKAAKITQIRAISGTCLFPEVCNMKAEDVVYTTVPLYHSSGFIISLLGVIGAGSTMVLRRKFSASHFWEDCCRHRVTMIQYIGELIRYLLAQPESVRDTAHCVRVAVGNGLREDIWEKFADRYKIPNIIEFFAATEGTSLLINLHNVPGACGRYSPLSQRMDPFPKYLIEFEPGTDQPKRDKNGHCIKVKNGQPGLLIAAFPPTVKPEDTYQADKSVIEKKLVRNVFKKGDLYFNYGDLLYLDSNYFFRFADRIGDTFRWKGENVSTQEVANALTRVDFILDANVYGVPIPGNDGKAGMACLVLNNNEVELSSDMCQTIYNRCLKSIPSYARPIFLRIQSEMELTGTYKQRKVNLVKEGFNPNEIQDPLFYLDKASKSYVPLTNQLHRKVLVGEAKL